MPDDAGQHASRLERGQPRERQNETRHLSTNSFPAFHNGCERSREKEIGRGGLTKPTKAIASGEDEEEQKNQRCRGTWEGLGGERARPGGGRKKLNMNPHLNPDKTPI